MIASRFLIRLAVGPLLIGALASCSAADFGVIPSSQNWTIFDGEQFAQVTIDKGGAMSQEAGGRVFSYGVTATCSMPIPLSGNWSGTAVRITSTGGACGAGYILTMTGTANGAYGDGDSMSGTYRISYSGKLSGVDTGNWTGTLVH